MPELRNAVATWVDQFVPAKRHSDDARIWLRATGSNAAKRGFIYFNRPFQWGQTLTTVKLHMFGVGTGWGSRTVWVEAIAAPGFENGISKANWNNQPGVIGAVIANDGAPKTNPVDGTEWIWDLTSRCQAIADAGKGWLGFRLTVDNDAGPYKFYSPRALKFRPYLEVQVTDAPEQPTMLEPDGGVVHLQNPTFRMDFTDYSGDQTMKALQVQLDAANNFATGIDFDTGTVLTDVPELDTSLATPGGTWAGLLNAASIYWRARVQDGSNKWSPWSDPAFFTRQTKAVLTLDNPAASPNNFVTEWTPPITWTFAGTQTGFRVIIERVSNNTLPDKTVHDSNYISGTANSYQVPRGVLTQDGQTYRVTVRVHDQYDREDLPGDKPFISVNRTFTYQAGATAPVTGLSASELVNTPFVKLTWTRATAPDSFTVKRDGKVIAVDVDPTEVLVSGTTYEWVDRGARPNVEHTWKVAANINGINSADADVVRTTIDVVGVWLYDPDQDITVHLGGTDPGSWEMPENAETHYPANGTIPVRITQAIYPWSGSFSTLTLERSEDGSMTGADWEDRLMRIKEYPGRPIYIIAADRAFRALIFDYQPGITDSVEPTDKAIGFSFVQVDDLTYNPRAA